MRATGGEGCAPPALRDAEQQPAAAHAPPGRWQSCYLLLEWSATPSARPINICRYAAPRGREGRARAAGSSSGSSISGSSTAAAILISHLSSARWRLNSRCRWGVGENRAQSLLLHRRPLFFAYIFLFPRPATRRLWQAFIHPCYTCVRVCICIVTTAKPLNTGHSSSL